MGNNWKKIMSLLLSVLMLLSVSAAYAEGGALISDTPVKIKLLAAISGSATGVVDDMNDIKFFGEMARRTNVQIEVIQAQSTSDAVQQFNLMIASGDLPDAAFIKTELLAGGVASYLDNGTIIGLNDLIDQYAPNIKKLFDEHPEWRSMVSTPEGIIYAIPKIKMPDLPTISHGLLIRTDWLENVNMEKPTTIDEWDAVFKAFKEQDANGNGDPNDEIPFTARTYTKLGQEMSVVSQMALGYGLSDGFAQKNGVVFYSPYEDAFGDLLAKLHEWYEKGYIDPDYLSLDEDSMNAKILSNQVGAFPQTLGSGLSKFLSVWKSENTGYTVEAAPYPLAPDGVMYNCNDLGRVISSKMLITSANKNPVETIKYFDYLFSEEGSILLNYGIEGESYTMVDGKPQFTDEIVNNPQGLDASNSLYRYCFGLADFPGPQLAESYAAGLVWPQQVQGYAIHAQSTTMNLIGLEHTAEESKIINRAWGDIETYTIEMMNKFVMGTEPIENFPQFQAALKSMGIEEIIEMKQAAYNRSIQK